MSYSNTEPTALKFLISNGDLVDESGNVLAHSDSLRDMYVKALPQVKKYLLSDGSVVDESGNVIIKNNYYKTIYEQAVPKAAKYLHSDGTINENSGSGADLESNKQVTIDVSQYTTPVEINPSSGKDGMVKATVTLDNIPSGGSVTLYAWMYNGGWVGYTKSETPQVGDTIWHGNSGGMGSIYVDDSFPTVVSVGTDTINDGYYDYDRNSEYDVTF